MRTVLVVEDQPAMLELICLYLTKAGFSVLTATDGTQAVAEVSRRPVNAVLLDVMLPALDGWEVCRRIRQQSNVPIIMVTAKSEEVDRILGLELGADDYITKPFSPRELVSRVRALLRRVDFENAPQPSTQVRLGDLHIDRDKRTVFRGATQLDLTPKEFDLLWLLAQHPGQVFEREQLLQRVWGYDSAGTYRTVDAVVRRLRRKVEPKPGEPVYIQTVRGVGYRCIRPSA